MLVLDRRNTDVRSFERHLGRTQLVRKDQGPHPRREMDTRGVGPAKRRVLDPATRKEDGDYTSGLHTGMGLTSFKDRLGVPRVARVCVHQTPTQGSRSGPSTQFRRCL